VAGCSEKHEYSEAATADGSGGDLAAAAAVGAVAAAARAAAAAVVVPAVQVKLDVQGILTTQQQ
jgi:polygalacturonase